MAVVFFSLLVVFLSGAGSAWAEFSSAVADKLWAKAVKPSLSELQSSNWMQVGGVGAFDPGGSAWIPGPFGYSDIGQLGSRFIDGENRSQRMLKLEFREPKGGAGSVMLLKTYEPPYKFTSGQQYLAYEETPDAVTFRVGNEGLEAIGLRSGPGIKENYSALFSCRAKVPNLLLCMASLEAKEPGAIPVLAPWVGKVFYRALYLKERAGGASPSSVPPPVPVAPGVSAAAKARGFKCTMNWSGGGALQSEVISFTILSNPARLGQGAMEGIGGAWDQSKPKVVDKVIVVRAREAADGTLHVGILKPLSASGFGADWKLEERLKNNAGLPMVGTLSIPKGGGMSAVQYPPGWGQNEEAYKKTLQFAPTTGHCEERLVAEPSDPYLWDVGLVR